MKHMGADLKDMTAINRRIAETVADAALSRVPVLTGSLRRTIKAGATRTRGSVHADGRSVPYAGVIDFGWPGHGIKTQPFIYEGLDDSKDAVVQMYETQIEALVEKVGRETPP